MTFAVKSKRKQSYRIEAIGNTKSGRRVMFAQDFKDKNLAIREKGIVREQHLDVKESSPKLYSQLKPRVYVRENKSGKIQYPKGKVFYNPIK